MSEDLVSVACRVTNGLELRLFDRCFDDGTGFRPLVPVGPTVVLGGPSPLHNGAGATRPGAPVVTEGVDREFMTKWLEQNKDSVFVTQGLVTLVEEAEA